jgi:Flp pilus assembly pilin Flp
MTALIRQILIEDDGVLSFEWTLLTTLLVIGIVGGVTAARDAITDELGDTAQVMLAVDQSYRIGFPLAAIVHDPAISSASDSQLIDALLFTDCGRLEGDPLPDAIIGQLPEFDFPDQT